MGIVNSSFFVRFAFFSQFVDRQLLVGILLIDEFITRFFFYCGGGMGWELCC